MPPLLASSADLICSAMQLDPQNTIPSKPYAQELGITDDAVADRITNKFLQLDPPEGKLSDWRKKELETAAREKEKKRRNTRAREEGCGLIGRRKRASLGKEALNRVRSVPFHMCSSSLS